jgi:hypothetical protein
MSVNRADCPRFTTSRAMARPPTTILGRAGVPGRGDTWANWVENGSRPSLAIENITREAEAWMARAAERMAMDTSTRRTLPSPVPSRL